MGTDADPMLSRVIPLKKLPSIQDKIRFALLILSGALLVVLTTYLSRALIHEKKREGLETLLTSTERDARGLELRLFAVERAVGSMSRLLLESQKTGAAQNAPLLGVQQVLDTAPNLERVLVYKRDGSDGRWVPWVSLQSNQKKLTTAIPVREGWSVDPSQNFPALVYLKTVSDPSVRGQFRIIATANVQDWVQSNHSQGFIGLIAPDQTVVKLLSDVLPEPLIKKVKELRLNDLTVPFEDQGKNYTAFVHQSPQGFWLLRWVDDGAVLRGVFALSLDLISLILLIAGVTLLIAIRFAEGLSRPFAVLIDGARRVGQGDFDLNIRADGNSESLELSDTLNEMARKIRDLIQTEREKVRIEQELKTASLIQATMIPPNEIDHGAFRVESHYESAVECGGDWWQSEVRGNKLLFVIADVTGHGAGSALVTAAIQSYFSTALRLIINFDDPNFLESFLKGMNTAVYSVSKGEQYATVFACVIDRFSGDLFYSNMGHPFPLILKGDGTGTRVLGAMGPRLGESIELSWSSEMLQRESFDKNDALFAYTDGLTDLKNSEGVLLRKKILRQKLEDLFSAKTPDIGVKVREMIALHRGDVRPDDDVTFGFIRIHPSEKAS